MGINYLSSFGNLNKGNQKLNESIKEVKEKSNGTKNYAGSKGYSSGSEDSKYDNVYYGSA